MALNTNLFSGSAGAEEDPGGQWTWLESVLAKSSKNKETVSTMPVAPLLVEKHSGGVLEDVRVVQLAFKGLL